MSGKVLLLSGLRFGMLLQLAVGPVCLLVLNTSAGQGLARTLPLIAAVTLADAFYIALSCLGVAKVVSRPRVFKAVRLIGGIVLAVFGLDMLLSGLGISLIPGIRLFSASGGSNLFAQGLLVTLSNPLTILFWSGMLTAKVAENSWNGRQLSVFSAGCVLATALFLTAVSALGSFAGQFLPDAVIRVLNAAVGAVLIYFGVRLALKKEIKK